MAAESSFVMLFALRDSLLRIVPKRFQPFYLVRTRTSGSVIAGPFTGMRHVGSSIGSAYYPKLLGTYEKELQEIIELSCNKQYESIIDVGAAEGYYAVGMAMRCNNANVVAFESEDEGRQLIAALATLNNVKHRIEIRGTCDTEALSQTLKQNMNLKRLIIMDVEGAEINLLQPEAISELKRCDILVEIHDGLHTGPIGDELHSRFHATHRIGRIWAKDRSVKDLPFRHSMFLDWRISHFMREGRTMGMSWLFMESLSQSAIDVPPGAI